MGVGVVIPNSSSCGPKSAERPNEGNVSICEGLWYPLEVSFPHAFVRDWVIWVVVARPPRWIAFRLSPGAKALASALRRSQVMKVMKVFWEWGIASSNSVNFDAFETGCYGFEQPDFIWDQLLNLILDVKFDAFTDSSELHVLILSEAMGLLEVVGRGLGTRILIRCREFAMSIWRRAAFREAKVISN
jgi:hypothetical protein